MSKSLFEKNLYDISKFEKCPSGWREVAVQDICQLGRGRVISEEEISSHPGPFPVYSSQTRNNGEMGRMDSFDFEGEWITWTTDGANAGTVFYRTGRFNCTNVCGTIRPKEDSELNLQFFAYHLGRIAKNYVSYLGNPKLMNDVMGRVALVIPPHRHQRKIARILTTLDELIEKTEALIAKYKVIKQGLMHDLFTRGVDEHGHLRPSYEDAPELYKESELGWIPKEWDVKELQAYLSYISYGFTNPMPDTEDGPWMVTAANVFSGAIQYKTCRHTSQTAFDTLLTNKSRPQLGDILLTKDGTLGRLAIVDRPGICINQSVAVLRPNGDASSEFLKFLLETPKYQQQMIDDAGGSTIKHIYITVVDKMPIAAPNDTSEQQKIAAVLSEFNHNIEIEHARLQKLRLQKVGLMQDLLTGEVEVTVDAEEVVSQ